MMKKSIYAAIIAAFVSFQAAAAGPLARHTIVYSTSEEPETGIEMARSVQSAILDATGDKLAIRSDKESPKGRKIIICRPETIDKFDYRVEVKSGNIILNGGGCWAMGKALNLVKEGLKNGRTIRELACSGNIYAEQLFPRTEGTDLRILDDNIWEYNKETIPSAWEALGVDCTDAVRYKAIAEVVLAYRPDIFTMQEYSSHMDKYLAPELAKYGYINCISEDGGHWNFTPVFYNENTIVPVQSQYVLYTPEEFSNHNSKSLTAGTFTLKSSGKSFCIVNTHLWWKSEKAKAGSDRARADQLRLCMDIADKMLSAAGDIPAFVVGDMNTTLRSPGIRQMLDYGYVPVQDAATVFGDRRCGHHVCSPKEGFSRVTHRKGDDGNFYGAIDHFMIYAKRVEGKLFAGAEVKVFERIQPYFTIEFTDHYPNYADIKL